MAPTRELALQIEQETSKFASAMNLRTCCVVGGVCIPLFSLLLELKMFPRTELFVRHVFSNP